MKRKGHTYPAPREVLAALNELSKAALVDIVCDALEVVGDDTDMSVALVAEFCNPRLEIRRDRLVPSETEA